MAYPPPPLAQRAPPRRNYGAHPPPPQAAGFQGQPHDGPYDQGYKDSSYDYYADGGYDDAGYGNAVPRSHGPPRGPPRPPRGGYGPPMEQPRDRSYAYNGRPPPGPDNRRGYGDRRGGPPRQDRMKPSGRHPQPTPDKMAWDNPFPMFPAKETRNPPDSKGIERGMADMDLNGQMRPGKVLDRPHTSNSRRDMPRQPGPAPPGRGGGNYPDGPVRSASAGRRGPGPSGYERSYTDPSSQPPMPQINRSATMPVSAAPVAPLTKPSYPGQATYQDLNGANDYSDTEDLLSYYNSPHAGVAGGFRADGPHADESDMPNFDAIPDGSKAFDENLPGLEQTKPKPVMESPTSPQGQYTAFSPHSAGGVQHSHSQPNMRAANLPNQFDNAGFQFDIPMQGQYGQQQGIRGPAMPAYGNDPHQPYQPGYPNEQPSGMNDMEAFDPQHNPDALPNHPVPFRPGHDQGPAPVRQYNDTPTPGTSSNAGERQLVDQPSPESQPVTHEELKRLQQQVNGKVANEKTQLLLVKKLVEASTVLVDNTRLDTKTKAKARERYITEAHRILKKLVSNGYADAQFYLADCYGQGQLGLQVDPREAFNLYHSAAKQGHAQSAYRVAVCCEIGQEEGGGTKRDASKAVQWYKRAASLGDPPAMYKMGMILVKGLLGQAKNPREGVSWLKRAAERADEENPHALHELALMYANATSNDVIIRDEAYASQLFHQAAELGYKFSQFRLGAAYEYGLMGCPVDPRQSIIWYTRAAAQGEHQSELSLSGWYLTGSEGMLQQSDTEAYLWARKAAAAGLAKAEYAMGYFTEVGIGVASNLDDAKRWYWRAAAQGFPKARERLEELKKGGARMQKTRLSRSAVKGQNQSEGDCVLM